MPPLPNSTTLSPLAAGLTLGGIAWLAAALAPPAQAQALAVSFPRPGVVCDGPHQVCFDSQGASLPITRQYFGPAAANQLLAQLSGRPPQREFSLSSGQLCDLSQRVCWDDGWRRRRMSVMLSRQLFGTSSDAGSGSGSLLPPSNPAASRSCALSQRGLPVFNGTCSLYRQSDGDGQTYVVQMGGGQLYRFQRRGNLLVLRDATGTWPVILFDRGNSVQFRWANLVLLVSRPMQPRGGVPDASAPPSLTPRSSGESGQDLIDGLFP